MRHLCDWRVAGAVCKTCLLRPRSKRSTSSLQPTSRSSSGSHRSACFKRSPSPAPRPGARFAWSFPCCSPSHDRLEARAMLDADHG